MSNKDIQNIQRELDKTRTYLREAQKENGELKNQLKSSVPESEVKNLKTRIKEQEKELKRRDIQKIFALEADLKELKEETVKSLKSKDEAIEEIQKSKKVMIVELQEAKRQVGVWKGIAETSQPTEKEIHVRDISRTRIRKSQRD